MARRKQTVTQRSFALGQTNSDLLEGDDLELRANSVRGGLNTRVTSARTLKARGGTIYQRTEQQAHDIIEIRPTTDAVFGLVVTDHGVRVLDSAARLVRGFGSIWDDPTYVWVEPYRADTLIGWPGGIKVLHYEDDAWSISDFAFETAPGGEIAQPYWAFNKTVQLKPSATTGAITVTASGSLFSADWVGMAIRWGTREIILTGYTSPTVMDGTVTSTLPPTFEIEVTSSASFRVGDAVDGEDTGFQGQVVGIAGDTLYIVTLNFFDGPDISENINSPSGKSAVVSKTEVAPLYSSIWDEPLISPVRGYPRSATSAAGRMIMVDFPEAPSMIACSSARSIFDWEVGASDDDAILREVGDNQPRFLHAINAGDLLLLSDRGCYYVPLRTDGVLSPSSFNAVFFDQRSSSEVKPVRVDSGVVFVEASGTSIAAALLDGNIYLKWSVKPITPQHSDIISNPVKLCGPSLFSTATEKYLFVINGDGTLATISWFGEFGGDSVGFLPWSTEGVFISVSPLFGGYWATVDRTFDSTTSRFVESFDDSAYLDCTMAANGADILEVNGDTLDVNGDSLTVVTPAATPLAGAEVHIWSDGYYGGTVTVASDGTVTSDEITDDSVVGFNFFAEISPWPVEVLEVPYAGMKRCRTIRSAISVKDTRSFQCIANGTTKTVEAYVAGDDLSAPPPNKTGIYRFTVFGLRDHPTITYRKHEPGPFHAMAITTEVQA